MDWIKTGSVVAGAVLLATTLVMLGTIPWPGLDAPKSLQLRAQHCAEILALVGTEPPGEGAAPMRVFCHAAFITQDCSYLTEQVSSYVERDVMAQADAAQMIRVCWDVTGVNP